MLMVGPRPRRRIPRLPPRLQSPGRNSAGRTTTKVRYHRIQSPTYLVIVLRLLQELVERDLLTHGGSVVGILPSPSLRRSVASEK